MKTEDNKKSAAKHNNDQNIIIEETIDE